MSGGGGSQTTQSSGSQNSVQQIPAWMSNAGQQNYALAQDIATRPLQQYQGQMVADTAPQTQQAWNLAAGSGNVGQPAFNASTAGYLGALGATPGTVTPSFAPGVGRATAITDPGDAASIAGVGSGMQVSNPGFGMQVYNPGNANEVSGGGGVGNITAGQLANTNLDPYMNPFTQSVINQTLPIMQQQLGLQQNALGNQAASAGAFGGSRQGVQAGVTQAQGAMNMAQMAAALNQANFAQAQAGATGDINRTLQADTTNQASQQTTLARMLQAAGMNQQSQQTDLARQAAMQLANQQSGQTDLARMAQMELANQASGQTDLARQQAAELANQANQQTNLQRAWQTGATNQASQQTDLARAAANRQFNATLGLTAQQANQAATQNKILSDIQAAGGLANLGTTQQRGLASLYTMLSNAGAGQQQQAQDQINAQIQKQSQAFNYPQQGLGLMLSALGMTPHDVSQYGTTNQTSTATTNQGAGGLALGGLQSLGNIWSMLPSASDPKIKAGITPLGNDPVTGVPIKAFRFKGEPAAAPKVIGPMATDIAKIAPAAVVKIGGVKHVPRPVLAAATPSVAHLPSFAANTMRGPLAPQRRAPRPRVLGALGG